MLKSITLIFLCLTIQLNAQSKIQYLEQNRLDLNSPTFSFPEHNFKIIGFGAYHGSAKTENAEIELLKSLTTTGTIKYYLPETDFSIAHYFNQYLKTGDTLLLKDLVLHYGARVPQEQTVETYQKWQQLKNINDKLPESQKITVVGIDLMVTYKYTIKHLLELLETNSITTNPIVLKMSQMVDLDTTDFSPSYESYSRIVMRKFVAHYEANTKAFDKLVNDPIAFEHILANITRTFTNPQKRGAAIFENYKELSNRYSFNENSQFLRFGFSHLMKQRQGEFPSFFTKLIDQGIYKRKEVVTIVGYLTESTVLWDLEYDDNGNYISYTTEAGFGIGDYEKEYFLGIENLKQTKISDMTLFRLNAPSSPFDDGKPELIEVVMTDEESNGEWVKGKSTTEFIDYGILISNSTASRPIFELHKK